jgi:hypothetical protein
MKTRVSNPQGLLTVELPPAEQAATIDNQVQQSHSIEQSTLIERLRSAVPYQESKKHFFGGMSEFFMRNLSQVQPLFCADVQQISSKNIATSVFVEEALVHDNSLVSLSLVGQEIDYQNAKALAIAFYFSIINSVWRELSIPNVLTNIMKEYLGEPVSPLSFTNMHAFFKPWRIMISPTVNKLLEPIKLYSESKNFWGLPHRHSKSAASMLELLKPFLNNYLLLSTTSRPCSGFETMRWIEKTIHTTISSIQDLNEPNEGFKTALEQALENIKKEFPLQSMPSAGRHIL